MRVRPFILTALLCAAPLAHGHGDVHERIEMLTKKLEQKTDQPDLLIQRARLYLEEGHAEEAKGDLKKALELDLNRHEALYHLGQAQLRLREHDAALQSTQRFLDAVPSDAAKARGLILQGDVLFAAGQPLKAGDVYVQGLALEHDPNPDHFVKAADAYHAAKSNKAVEVLDNGIARLGPLTVLQERAIAIDMETRRYEDALKRVDQMLAARQRLPYLLYKKGVILKALHKDHQSRQTFKMALKEIENLPEQRKNARAVEELREAIRKELGA